MEEFDAIGEERREETVVVGVVVIEEVVSEEEVCVWLQCDEVSWDMCLLSLCGFAFSAESWSLGLLLVCGVCAESSRLISSECVFKAFSILAQTVFEGSDVIKS